MLNGFKSSKWIAGGPGHHHPQHGVSKSPTSIDRWYKDHGDYEQQFKALQSEMHSLQTTLYAEKKQALLVIFQGMDAAGKDSAIAHVMSGLNPSGTTVSAFAAPNAQELSHDFLWRTHAVLPARGKIGIFNRSYYEEVSTVRVHPEYLQSENLPARFKFNDKFWEHRLKDIRHHEEYLDRQGFQIVKFFLNISREEQRKRLLARIDDRNKNWKFDPSDILERSHWADYHRAWDRALAITSTKVNPWYVIPSDDKENARLMICQIVVEKLRSLKSTYPILSPASQRDLKRIRRNLKTDNQ